MLDLYFSCILCRVHHVIESRGNGLVESDVTGEGVDDFDFGLMILSI